MRSALGPAAALLLASCAAGTAPSAGSLVGYWEGHLESEGYRWTVGLAVEESADGLRGTVDVPSLWIAATEAGYIGTTEAVAIELPGGLGRFEGAWVDGVLEGEVATIDGRLGHLTLRRVVRHAVELHDVSFSNGEVVLAGTLGVPSGDGPFPGLVILHGGGDSSRELEGIRFFAEYFPRFGIATLVYDKRGNGQSTGDWRAVGFEERADDVLAGVRLMRARSDIVADAIGLYGASQGSWVAGIAARRDPSIAFVVHVAGPAVSVLEADTYAHLSRYRRVGATAGELQRAERLWNLSVQVTREASRASWETLERELAAAADSRVFRDHPYAPPAFDSPFREWYRRVVGHDPVPVLADLSIPMLWLFGSDDTESDPYKNLTILEGLRAAGQPYTLRAFPGAGHGLMISTDRARDRYTTAPGFFDAVLDWILALAPAGLR